MPSTDVHEQAPRGHRSFFPLKVLKVNNRYHQNGCSSFGARYDDGLLTLASFLVFEEISCSHRSDFGERDQGSGIIGKWHRSPTFLT